MKEILTKLRPGERILIEIPERREKFEDRVYEVITKAEDSLQETGFAWIEEPGLCVDEIVWSGKTSKRKKGKTLIKVGFTDEDGKPYVYVEKEVEDETE